MQAREGEMQPTLCHMHLLFHQFEVQYYKAQLAWKLAKRKSKVGTEVRGVETQLVMKFEDLKEDQVEVKLGVVTDGKEKKKKKKNSEAVPDQSKVVFEEPNTLPLRKHKYHIVTTMLDQLKKKALNWNETGEEGFNEIGKILWPTLVMFLPVEDVAVESDIKIVLRQYQMCSMLCLEAGFICKMQYENLDYKIYNQKRVENLIAYDWPMKKGQNRPKVRNENKTETKLCVRFAKWKKRDEKGSEKVPTNTHHEPKKRKHQRIYQGMNGEDTQPELQLDGSQLQLEAIFVLQKDRAFQLREQLLMLFVLKRLQTEVKWCEIDEKKTVNQMANAMLIKEEQEVKKRLRKQEYIDLAYDVNKIIKEATPLASKKVIRVKIINAQPTHAVQKSDQGHSGNFKEKLGDMSIVIQLSERIVGLKKERRGVSKEMLTCRDDADIEDIYNWKFVVEKGLEIMAETRHQGINESNSNYVGYLQVQGNMRKLKWLKLNAEGRGIRRNNDTVPKFLVSINNQLKGAVRNGDDGVINKHHSMFILEDKDGFKEGKLSGSQLYKLLLAVKETEPVQFREATERREELDDENHERLTRGARCLTERREQIKAVKFLSAVDGVQLKYTNGVKQNVELYRVKNYGFVSLS